MSMIIPTGEILKAGNNLIRIAERISDLSNRASGIGSAISSCYMNGGVGNRASTAVSRMQHEQKLVQEKGKIFCAAVNIYEGKEQQLGELASSVASTIDNGYNVSWSGNPVIKAILTFGILTVTSPALFVTAVTALKSKFKDTEEFITISPDVTIRDEQPMYVELKKPGEVFYSNVDLVDGQQPYNNRCPNNAAAMVVESVAEPDKVAELVKSKDYSNLREYAVTMGYGPTALANELDLDTRTVKIGGTDSNAAENTIKESLKNSTSGVGYLWFNAGKADFGHAVMVYLDENDELMVNDPGGGESWGKNKLFLEKSNYWLSTGRTFNNLIIVERN